MRKHPQYAQNLTLPHTHTTRPCLCVDMAMVHANFHGEWARAAASHGRSHTHTKVRCVAVTSLFRMQRAHSAQRCNHSVAQSNSGCAAGTMGFAMGTLRALQTPRTTAHATKSTCVLQCAHKCSLNQLISESARVLQGKR